MPVFAELTLPVCLQFASHPLHAVTSILHSPLMAMHLSMALSTGLKHLVYDMYGMDAREFAIDNELWRCLVSKLAR